MEMLSFGFAEGVVCQGGKLLSNKEGVGMKIKCSDCKRLLFESEREPFGDWKCNKCYHRSVGFGEKSTRRGKAYALKRLRRIQ